MTTRSKNKNGNKSNSHPKQISIDKTEEKTNK